MPTPSSAPRHLPPTGPGTPVSTFGGRQAAKVRALVSADLLPRERASADALVLTAWLTAAQRAQYAQSLRSGPQAEEFAQRLADERRVVLEKGADEVPGERESAAQAEAAARQIGLRLLEALLLAIVVAAVGAAVLLALRSPWPDLASRVPDQSLALLAVMVVAALLAAAVGRLATRRRDRALLDWAVSRPGQLGRGLPLRRPLQGDSAGPALVRSLGPALLVGTGVLAIVAGAAVLLISLMVREDLVASQYAPWMLGGGAAALVLAVGAVYLRSRRLLRIARRTRAAQWIGTTPQEEDPGPL